MRVYECAPVRYEWRNSGGPCGPGCIEHDHVQVVVCAEHEATAWGVYRRGRDGLAHHVGDAHEKEDARLLVEELNKLHAAPEAVLRLAGETCNALGKAGVSMADIQPLLTRLEDALYEYDSNQQEDNV